MGEVLNIVRNSDICHGKPNSSNNEAASAALRCNSLLLACPCQGEGIHRQVSLGERYGNFTDSMVGLA